MKKILKAARKKEHIAYTETIIEIHMDFSSETLQRIEDSGKISLRC